MLHVLCISTLVFVTSLVWVLIPVFFKPVNAQHVVQLHLSLQLEFTVMFSLSVLRENETAVHIRNIFHPTPQQNTFYIFVMSGSFCLSLSLFFFFNAFKQHQLFPMCPSLGRIAFLEVRQRGARGEKETFTQEPFLLMKHWTWPLRPHSLLQKYQNHIA